MKLAWQCMFSPRLYKIYRDGPTDAFRRREYLEDTPKQGIYIVKSIKSDWGTIGKQGLTNKIERVRFIRYSWPPNKIRSYLLRRPHLYQPQGLEKWGDKVISAANTLLNIGLYTSPFICMYVYKRGFFTVDESKGIARIFGSVGCLIAFSFLIRGIGRATNPKYVAFLKALTAPAHDQKAYVEGVRKYDFDFRAWPVSYAVSIKEKSTWLPSHPLAQCANPDLPLYQRATIQVLAYVATHTFALRLIYPGSLSIVNTLLWSTLFQGRSSLVESHGGKRSKVVTAEGNHIDTMFVDNRQQSLKGKTLVVCSEGNSGFYEIGIMSTPVNAGYSALGWNHPGFASSTGYPYPSQEHNAIDAVTQYAINELGFQPEDIVMFGWSIGGYTAAWGALRYPVKALILDATFDDLLPLAQNQMPTSWRLLVKEVIRSYVDLNVAELVTKYNGPVHLVRRTQDEIICLRQGLLSTNRGNDLLLRLIEARHPGAAVCARDEAAVAPLDKFVALTDAQRVALKRSDIAECDRSSLNLIAKYMLDYKSTHCTPLPEQIFESIMTSMDKKSD